MGLENERVGGETREAFKSLKLNGTHGRDVKVLQERRESVGGEKKGERRPARPAVWKPATAGNKNSSAALLVFDAGVKFERQDPQH